LVVQNEIIVFINPKITELIGLSENKIINKPFLDLVYERDKLDVFCHLYSTNINIINNNISFQYFKHKSENDWASINTASIIWEGNAAILVFFSDITNQKKAEQQILQQTEELKLQAEVLENSNFEITIQKEEIQKTHKQIVSSINYASLIQKAILPQHKFIDSLIPNHFIIYKPRDIVSGDFYFVKRIKNKIILAVADCTGHGVPGAILSMLGIALLNEIIRKPEIITADIVLNELRNEIKNSLHQTGIYGEQQDGMDIAICVIDTENLMLQFAGAYNPLWIFRKINDNKTSNKYNFIELKADRMPIGIYVKEKPFTQQIYQLQKNDVLYMFSDGFYSQFGQNNNTKYKLGKFKTFISSICTKEIHEQQLLLEEEYTTWKGKTDQTDDVLVMGLKI